MKNPYEVIKIDKYTGKIQTPTLLLMNRSFDIIGKISRYENWNISLVANGVDEITFEVHKYVNGKLCPIWDDLIDLKIVNVKNFGYFEISVDYTDNSETVKSVHGVSLETELAQIGLYEFHINDDEATDMVVNDNITGNYDDEGNYVPTVFYNPDDEKHSLLHRVLADKAPHWSIGHVPLYIALSEDDQPEYSYNFQRTYTVDGDSIYDFLTGTVSEETNVVFVFDTINRIINCYNLCDCIDQNTGDILEHSIGEDTTVFVSKNKLANEITISSNKDNVKNCFRIEGGDDIITDMVRAVNMNGSNYIYQLADFQYNDMSETLKTKLKDYQDMMSDKKTHDEYYGNGDIDSFLEGNLILKINSELDANSIMNICNNNKIETDGISIYDYNSNPYWYVVMTNNTKKLCTSETVMDSYVTASEAINTMGIFSRLCNAYDELAYYESSMMPNTNPVTKVGKAEEQYNKVVSALKDTTVAVSSMNNYNENLFVGVTNNIEAYAQIFIDSRFDLEVVSGTTSYSYVKDAKTGTWKGKIRIKQHTDENNVYPIDISTVSELEITVNADELTFAKQKIEKALSEGSILDIDFDIADMNNDEIREYFEQYSLNRLNSFYDGYNSCISVLMQMDENSTVRQDLYKKYIGIMTIISNHPTSDNPDATLGVLEIRQAQVDGINENIKEIKMEQKAFIFGLAYNDKKYDPHDFKTYIGDGLYKEFCAYRREDTYSNSNYISDGYTTSECLQKAKELVEVATKEAKKACVLQRTVSTSLNNLFALPEFEPLYEKFALYNYIRIRTEDEILKLRLIGVEFNGDSVEEIQVTFSEQIESVDGTMSDLQSIIQQVGSLSTSFPSTSLQAKQGAAARNLVAEMYNTGLNAANTMLKTNDSNEVTITSAGIICKRMDDEGYYGEKQFRITGNMIAFTKNNWKSVELAIGETIFKDPITGENKQAYGIIAENIVGKLMASENMYISNNKGSVEITGDGIRIYGGCLYIKNQKDERSVTIDPQQLYSDKGYIFKITDKDGNITIGADPNGNACFSGTIHATNGEFTGEIKSGSSITCGENFRVDINGNMTCENANVKGKITADDGKIGNFIISTKNGSWGDLYADSMIDKYKYRTYIQSASSVNGDEASWIFSFQKGVESGENPNKFDAIFCVKADGEIFAKGDIFAEGRISAGGFFYDDNNLNVTGNSYFNGNISSTADISANGNITSHGEMYSGGYKVLKSYDGRVNGASWVDIDGISYLAISVDDTTVYFKPDKYTN